MLRFKIICLLITFGSFSVHAQEAINHESNWKSIPNQEEELGNVKWSRSYAEAISKANESDKPIFILFQEVPGCLTCRNYGNHLLTHPHIVEAIESYFIPLVIFNNKNGDDARILRKFNEPSWNNPVVRIIDPSSEKDIAPRLNGRYDMAALTSTINAAILADHKLVPKYLDLLEKEHSSTDIRETNLAMYCFWSGEKHLGEMEGVLKTQAGFMNGAEVVKVKYDAAAISDRELFSKAHQKNCADGVYTNDQRSVKTAKQLKISTSKEGKFKPDREPKYYTFNSDYKYLPMTGLQALKVNTALSKRESPERYLSPRQLEFLKEIKAGKLKKVSVVDKDFYASWNSILKSSQS